MDYKEKVIALLNSQELTKEQKEKLENIFPELKEKESEDERIRKELIAIYSVGAKVNAKTGDIPDRDIVAWLEKQGKSNTFKVPETSIKVAEEVTSRMQYIEDDMKPIAEFIINYANWDLHKDEWNQPTLTVPLFRVLDALIQRGKPYGECVQNIEKQGENEPTDKVKPKFKVGDFIVNDYCSGKVIEITNDAYLLDTGQGIPFSCEHNAHLWTIEDAKDGDVLTNGESIVIFKQIVEPKYRQYIEAYIGLDWGCNIQVTSESWSLGIDKTMPATKEQRELLFQKIKEAGYEWDREKKELKKIEAKTLDADKVIEWLNDQACLGWIEDVEVEKFVEQLKEDFGLC